MSAPWLSLHVFIHDFARLNHFLLNCLALMPPAFREHSFFIRYWHGGPHVRIRFRDAGLREVLDARVAAYLREHAFDADLDSARYYQVYAAHWDTEGPRDWHPNGSAQYIAYRPEVARYGGEAGLALCEDYFVADSQAALTLLAGCTAAQVDQALFGYCLVQARVLAEAGWSDGLVHAGVDAQATLSRLRPQLLAVRSAVDRGVHLPDILAPFEARLRHILAGLLDARVAAPAAVLHSLLHMSFNRVGITPAREETIRLFAQYARNEGD